MYDGDGAGKRPPSPLGFGARKLSAPAIPSPDAPSEWRNGGGHNLGHSSPPHGADCQASTPVLHAVAVCNPFLPNRQSLTPRPAHRRAWEACEPTGVRQIPRAWHARPQGRSPCPSGTPGDWRDKRSFVLQVPRQKYPTFTPQAPNILPRW
jgi:hypothetical protein